MISLTFEGKDDGNEAFICRKSFCFTQSVGFNWECVCKRINAHPCVVRCLFCFRRDCINTAVTIVTVLAQSWDREWDLPITKLQMLAPNVSSRNKKITLGSYSCWWCHSALGKTRVEIWFVAAWSFFISRVRSEAKMFLLDRMTPTGKSKKNTARK